MARKITSQTSEDAEIMPDIVDADWSEPDAEQEELRRQADDAERVILDGLEIDTHNHEYYAYVYKKVNGRKEYCEQVGIEAFPLQERLRQKWRGGVFEIMVFKDGKIWKNKTYRIASQPHDEPFKSSPLAAKDGTMSEIAQMLRQQTELIASLRQEGSGSPRNSMEEMSNMLQMMQLMRNVFIDNKSAVDPTDMLFKGIELVEKVRGEQDGGEENMYSFLKSMFSSPLVQNMAQQNSGPQRQAVPGSRPLTFAQAAPAPAPEAETPPPVLAFMPPPMRDQIAGQIAYWLDRAKNNKDPVLYAELAVDTYEEQFVRNVLMHAETPNVIAYYAPETRHNEELRLWFNELLTAIATLLTDEPNEQTTSVENSELSGDAPFKNSSTAKTVINPERKSGSEGNAAPDAGIDAGRQEKRAD